jgi:hypothetical protein
MDKDFLTLKRAPIGPNEEDYGVLFDGVLVGRIVLSPSRRKIASGCGRLTTGTAHPLMVRAYARRRDGGIRQVRATRVARLARKREAEQDLVGWLGPWALTHQQP